MFIGEDKRAFTCARVRKRAVKPPSLTSSFLISESVSRVVTGDIIIVVQTKEAASL